MKIGMVAILVFATTISIQAKDAPAYEKGVLIRTTGDIIALSPPLVISKPQIDELVGTLGGVLREMGRE